MIKNQTIIDKLKQKTSGDMVMQNFLLDIINHENENSQYSKEYTKGGADKKLDYYRTPKGVFICIPKNKNQPH